MRFAWHVNCASERTLEPPEFGALVEFPAANAITFHSKHRCNGSELRLQTNLLTLAIGWSKTWRPNYVETQTYPQANAKTSRTSKVCSFESDVVSSVGRHCVAVCDLRRLESLAEQREFVSGCQNGEFDGIDRFDCKTGRRGCRRSSATSGCQR